VRHEVPDRIILNGETDNEYISSDIHMVQALLSLQHKPVRIFGEGGTLFFVFDKEDITDNLTKLVSNSDVVVAIRDVWAASRVWSMVMYEFRNG
jgi:hypothetical protein